LYKGHFLDKKYQVDFICHESIIIELKALQVLNSLHDAQLINYLKATNMQLGILVNFGQRSLENKRLVNNLVTN
jgi:GxxExxY protein